MALGLFRYTLFLTLLLSSAAVIAAVDADDGVDRTDFSDPALSSDLDKKPKTLLPHTDVEASSMIVQPIGENLPIGVASYLLVSLANLGSKMFNVTKINGQLSDVRTGKALANFTRRMYGDPLGPREQRSFRYQFVPNKKLSPGEYRIVFSAFYSNRDKEPFSTVVYNETNVLVPGPPEPSELPLLNIAMGVAAALAIAIAYTQFSSAPTAKSAQSGDTRPAEEATQWLPGNTDVLSASPRKKKTAAKRA